MEMEECWDTDTEVDEVNDDDIDPLLGAASTAAAVLSQSERATAACLAHATGAHEQQQQQQQQAPHGDRRGVAASSSAAGRTGGTGGIPRTPNSDANGGATLARLVSTWGPVTAQDGWRQAAAAAGASPASMDGVGSGVVGQVRRGFRDGFNSTRSEAYAHRGASQGGAARGDRVGGARASRRNRNSGGGGAQDGDRGRDPLEDVSEGGGSNNGLLAAGLPSGLGLSLGGGAEASLAGLSNNNNNSGGGGREPSSPASSDSSDEDSSSGGVEPNPPEELLRALVGARITIALLLLLMCHYVVTHLLGIAGFSVGTAVVVVLDQRLWSHSDAQTLRNRFVLMGVAVTAVFVVALSATVLSNFPQGEGLLRRLLLVAPKPPVLGTVSAVIRTTIVVDIWARLLSVTVKAVLAVVSVPDRDSSGNGSTSGNGNSSGNGSISSGGGGGRVSRHGTGLFARVR
ncbi:unnamed protein product, partial [Ectocarpus fasciculatus]